MPDAVQDGRYLGGLAASIDGAERYLGDPDYVDALVRQFVSDVLTRADTATTPVLAAQAGATTAAQAIALGQIFTGAQTSAMPMPDWNREGGGLGEWVRRRFADQIDGAAGMTDADLIANAFAILGHAVVEVAQDHADSDDDDAAALSINALVEDWCDLLLGIPTEDDAADLMLASAAERPETNYDREAGE